jgi:protein disulfide-isomerase
MISADNIPLLKGRKRKEDTMGKACWLSIAVIGLQAVTAVAGEGWLTDFEQAKKLAAEREVPILADFSGSDWCGWCIRLDREVFSKKEFKQFAQSNVVLFLADFPSGKKQSREVIAQNKRLQQKYRIRGYPTVLLLDAQGEVLASTGYQPGGAESYVKHIKALIKGAQG